MTEGEILASVMDSTRGMTNYYFSKLKDTDLHRVFNAGDVALNSAFWIMAHLAVTENWLLLRSTGAEHVKIPWARQFGMGAQPYDKGHAPQLDEVMQTLGNVHELSLTHVRSLTDEQLKAPNTTGFDLFGSSSVRDVVVHAIRHEGSHGGHLGWLCKLNGIKTL